jgi:hypothetical protein
MSTPEPRVMVLCCPGLCWPGGTTPPDPPARAWPRTARGFDQVLTAVTAFCPAVEAVEPGVCAFGARGPARYFGGETALGRLAPPARSWSSRRAGRRSSWPASR